MKNNIIQRNKYKERYNNNNDCYMHVRLTDAVQYNPGSKYYIKALSNIDFDTLYISTDDFKNPIIKDIIASFYPNKNVTLVNIDYLETIQFASTCKYIVLSHGTYSAIIGYLAFNSASVFYPEYEKNNMWHGDIFSIDGWNKITDYK